MEKPGTEDRIQHENSHTPTRKQAEEQVCMIKEQLKAEANEKLSLHSSSFNLQPCLEAPRQNNT